MDAGEGAGGVGRSSIRIAEHEGVARGHTIHKHVGKSTEYLRNRVATHPSAARASSFADEASADRFIGQVIQRRAHEIREWLTSHGRALRLDDVFDQATGDSVDRAGVVSEVRGIRIVLARDPSMADGYWIKTAFPQP